LKLQDFRIGRNLRVWQCGCLLVPNEVKGFRRCKAKLASPLSVQAICQPKQLHVQRRVWHRQTGHRNACPDHAATDSIGRHIIKNSSLLDAHQFFFGCMWVRMRLRIASTSAGLRKKRFGITFAILGV
jgi:hypothetical protein